MNGFQLTSHQVKNLKLLHKKQKERRAADKIKALVLLGTGWTLEAVSEALLLDTETLRSYVKKYREGKIDKALELNYKGSESRLSDEEKRELKIHLSEYTYLDIKSIIAHIKKKFKVDYKPSRMGEILKELGFVYKKPKLIPGKSNSIETMKYLQRYEKIRRSGLPLYFMDGVHPQHNSRPSHGWILKGENKALLSNTGRQRLNINGAVNIDTKDLIVSIDESVNAQSTIKLFKKILVRHKKDKKIYVVCDNAGYYRSTLVSEFIQETKKIELIFLPPYSPFLNLIERVWKFFNKMVLYNKYYPYFLDFKNACIDFLSRKHKRALDKKLVEKFHFSDKNLTPLQLAPIL